VRLDSQRSKGIHKEDYMSLTETAASRLNEPPINRSPWLAAFLMQSKPRLLARFVLFRHLLDRLPKGKKRWLAKRARVSLAGAALLFALSTPALGAGSIIVDPGEVAVADNGLCSIVEALDNANDTILGGQVHNDCVAGDPTGADTIILPSDSLFTIGNLYSTEYISYCGDYGSSALPPVSTDVTIEGNGATIQTADGADRWHVLGVSVSGDAHVNNLNVLDNYPAAEYRDGNYYYNVATCSGIVVAGRLTVTGSTFRGHKHGIYNNYGEVFLSDSIITGNNGAGFANWRGESTLSDCEIIGNYSGGINSDGGTLVVNGCTLSGNVGRDFGGLLGLSSDVMIIDSTINNNTATEYYGGGLLNLGADMIVINSTISGNRVVDYPYRRSGGGGGISVFEYGTLQVINSTITANIAEGSGGGIFARGASSVSLSRSIVSGNTAYDSADEISSEGALIIVDDGNVFSDASKPTGSALEGFTLGASDVDASSDSITPFLLSDILDPSLNGNGGSTQTHALVPGSPAIDLGSTVACSAPPVNGLDQRRILRNVDGDDVASSNECDAGAFEYVPLGDGDGVDGTVEDAGPNNGDGNYDGVPDSEQPNVTSLPNAANGDYLTIEAPEGTVLEDVNSLGDVSPESAPPNVLFPLGYLGFALSNLIPGQAVSINLYLENPETINAYYKYGPTVNTPTDHWYSFTYDGETGVEVIAPDRLTLHLVDGKRGDSDLTANGTIVDPGGPAFANRPPVVDAGTQYDGDEGSPISLDGASATDTEGDVLTYKWSVDTPLCSFSDDNLLAPEITCRDNGSFTATLTVSDGVNDSVSSAATVNIINVAPTISSLSGPTSPIDIESQTFSVSAAFSDPGSADNHSVTWNWGDGTSDTLDSAVGSAAIGHVYATPGVYTVMVTVTDDDGGSDSRAFEYIVVFDQEGGFITGGGWINSPVGAYVSEPELTGKANFGFVSKYKKGATVPTGNTEFQFKAGDLNFRSDSYDWLVVAGAKAMFKGVGTINGSGNYGFMLSAIDAAQTPSTDTDLFRIKIWDKGNGDAVVYDNQLGAGDDTDPTTAIGGGNIIVHKAK
jgi:hypothetical protein